MLLINCYSRKPFLFFGLILYLIPLIFGRDIDKILRNMYLNISFVNLILPIVGSILISYSIINKFDKLKNVLKWIIILLLTVILCFVNLSIIFKRYIFQ